MTRKTRREIEQAIEDLAEMTDSEEGEDAVAVVGPRDTDGDADVKVVSDFAETRT